jgi:hypothetical protein
MTNYGYAKIIGKTKKPTFCLSPFCAQATREFDLIGYDSVNARVED